MKNQVAHVRDGQELIEQRQTNLGDYSVSFMLEARTRGIEHVSMRRLASTQSKCDGPNQNSICSGTNFSLPYISNHFKRKEKWSQPVATRSSKSHGCKKRSAETRQTPLYWTDGRTTKYTERLNWYTFGLASGSSTSTTSPRLTSVMMHLTDSDYDMKAQST